MVSMGVITYRQELRLFLLLCLNILPCSFGETKGGAHLRQNQQQQQQQQQPRRQMPSDISLLSGQGNGGSNRNRFPYFVHFPCHDEQQRNCGGSLVAPDIVLTSASCR